MNSDPSRRDDSFGGSWVLHPPIRGNFTRATISLAVFPALPAAVVVVAAAYWGLLLGVGLPAFALLLIIGLLVDLGWAWLIISLGYAVVIRVGSEGIAVYNRRYFGGRVREVAKLSWEDVRLRPPGLFPRLTKTILVSSRRELLVLEIDYAQARAVLEHGKSRVSTDLLPSRIIAEIVDTKIPGG